MVVDLDRALTPTDAGEPPLFVDLDGTRIKSDLLIECFFALVTKQPWCVLLMPFWLLSGKVYLKAKIAERNWRYRPVNG